MNPVEFLIIGELLVVILGVVLWIASHQRPIPYAKVNEEKQ